MTATSPAPKPRRSRLQFSLRLLLLAFTAFAIGFPIWYRWPFEESKPLYPNSDKTKPPMGVSVRTWRRTWGGGKVASGKSMAEIDRPPRGIPRTKTIQYYQDDVQHGPFQHYWEGRLIGEGQYVRGLREGKWVDYDHSSGQITCIANWRHDRLDGPFEMRSYLGAKFDPFAVGGVPVEPPGERRQTFLFANGRLIDANGQPASNHLLDQLESGAIDNPQIASALEKLMPLPMEFVETPLKDVLAFLQDLHNLPFVLDTRRVADINRPITLNLKGVDLCSGLTMLTLPEKLTFEYRYGVLFLTTPQHAQDQRDPTGVADIRPEPGTPLARAWNEPCAIEVVEVPLDQALQSLGQPLAIEFDLTALPPEGIKPTPPITQQALNLRRPTMPVTKNLRNLPFKHVLGLLLDDLQLRCEARGKDTLVILPQQDPKEPEASGLR